jgi:hypothetical protein
MDAILGVGVPRDGVAGGWDFWLPFYILLTLLLVRVVVGFRITVWTSIAAFVAGSLWAWSVDVFGVIQAGGTAVLIAIAAGAIARRVPRASADPG